VVSSVLLALLVDGMHGAAAHDRPRITAQAKPAPKRPRPRPKPARRPAPASPSPTTSATAVPSATAPPPAPPPSIPAPAAPSPVVPPAPPRPKTGPPATTASPEKGGAPAAPSSIEMPWILFDAGYAFGDRWFRHSESSTGELRTYTAVRLHSAAGNFSIYPGEVIKLPVWRDVGITLSYLQAFGVTSNLAGQPAESANSAGVAIGTLSRGPFVTTYRRWDVGLR
jgi:hypothetical protein